MFLFSQAIYELLAAEIYTEIASRQTEPNGGQRLVEMEWDNRELLLRFHLENEDTGRIRISRWSMLTWCDGQRQEHNFEVDKLYLYL